MDFVDPDWDAPLDVDEYLQRVPPDETMKGMFLIPVVRAVVEKGRVLRDARERYVAFHDYPLQEHMTLLVGAANALYPRESLRTGLRRLGHGAIRVLLDSTVGRVLWASVVDPAGAIEAAVKAYAITQPRTVVSILESKPGAVIVRALHVHAFLDSHHIGVFEAALRFVGATGSVKIRRESLSDGDLLCTF